MRAADPRRGCVHPQCARRTQSIHWGFGYEAMRAEKPDLIYVHCVGFGSRWTVLATLQAYDDVIQAASGMATFLPAAWDGDPPPPLRAIHNRRQGGGNAWRPTPTLAAVIHKLRTGAGQFVEVPMFECFTQFLYEEHLFGGDVRSAHKLDRLPPPDRSEPPAFSHERWLSSASFPTPTKAWTAAPSPCLGDPAFPRTTRNFANTMLRALLHDSELYARMAELTPARTTAEWVQVAERGARAGHGGARFPGRYPGRSAFADKRVSSSTSNIPLGRCKIVAMRPPVKFSAPAPRRNCGPPPCSANTPKRCGRNTGL